MDRDTGTSEFIVELYSHLGRMLQKIFLMSFRVKFLLPLIHLNNHAANPHAIWKWLY